MFTKGRRSIYTELPANNKQFSDHGSITIDSKLSDYQNNGISNALSKTFTSINLGYSNSNQNYTTQTYTAYSYFGDHDITRITKNADALRQG